MTASAPIAPLARRLRAGETLFMSWCGVNDASIAEATAREDFDAALIDMQHGAVDLTTAMQVIALVGLAGKPAIARIPVGDFASASRLLDAGAAAIVAPMINSEADARRFAGFVKFPPVGERSWGPHRAFALAGLDGEAYFHAANDMHLAIAMIETREALDALDSILDVPGIDGVFVGPSDLSIALTRGAVVDAGHPEVDKALDHIAARCKAKNKVAGAFCMTGKRAKEVAAKGFRLCSISTDGMMLRLGARLELKAARN
ncbi:MAG TPA: aldolase/citrate lyase family protein [Rhodoblastus sp.]|nr:aldolase/citrate lyase family protein [Rhodoblastus sp.]